MESYDSNKVMHGADRYEELFKGVQTLKDYDDFNNTLLDDPIFVQSCEAFDSRVEPTSAQDIMAALSLHPSSGTLEYPCLMKLSTTPSSLITTSKRRMNIIFRN